MWSSSSWQVSPAHVGRGSWAECIYGQHLVHASSRGPGCGSFSWNTSSFYGVILKLFLHVLEEYVAVHWFWIFKRRWVPSGFSWANSGKKQLMPAEAFPCGELEAQGEVNVRSLQMACRPDSWLQPPPWGNNSDESGSSQLMGNRGSSSKSGVRCWRQRLAINCSCGL